jgi:hypothetical protein
MGDSCTQHRDVHRTLFLCNKKAEAMVMKRSAWFRSTAAILFLVAGVAGHSQIPDSREQFVYRINAFQGSDYSQTFCREEADTVYIIADAESFLVPVKTMVYYWPLTDEWLSDSAMLNERIQGNLEIEGPGKARYMMEYRRYAVGSVMDGGTVEKRVYLDDDSELEYSRYLKEFSEYQRTMAERQALIEQFERNMLKLMEMIALGEEESPGFTELLEPTLIMQELLQRPVPQRPNDVVFAPEEAFVLDLPEGEYRMRLHASDGTVFQDSEKRLIVHAPVQSRIAGLELRSEDRWTEATVSSVNHEILYADGSADLFLNPVEIDRYQDLRYRKTLRNDAEGNPVLMFPVNKGAITDADILLASGGSNRSQLPYSPWRVVQREGSALGYSILPASAASAGQEVEPDFMAHRIALDSRTSRTIEIRIVDSRGKTLPSGNRKIRIVRTDPSLLALFPGILSPLVLLTVVPLIRRKHVRFR